MSQHTNTALFDWMLRHPALTYLGMVALFLIFGLLSMDLIKIVAANTDYIAQYGFEALRDDGLLQMIELLGIAFAAVLSYLGFKLCEHALIYCAAHHQRKTDG